MIGLLITILIAILIIVIVWFALGLTTLPLNLKYLIMAVVGLVVLIYLLGGRGYAMGWYDNECCNERDCRQTGLGEVERHDDGWYVVSRKELIKFDDKRIRRSMDPLIHICEIKFLKKPTTRCLYVPEVAG